jgi:CDGSH-type Zn-finger protein
MDKPTVFDVKPASIELDLGKSYHWCSCGRSNNQPFCDGSHRETNMKPLEFIAESSGSATLCQCKQTGNPPYCDGSHTKLSDADVGKACTRNLVTDKAPPPRVTAEEPQVEYIHELAKNGLKNFGHHGPMAAIRHRSQCRQAPRAVYPTLCV